MQGAREKKTRAGALENEWQMWQPDARLATLHHRSSRDASHVVHVDFATINYIRPKQATTLHFGSWSHRRHICHLDEFSTAVGARFVISCSPTSYTHTATWRYATSRQSAPTTITLCSCACFVRVCNSITCWVIANNKTTEIHCAKCIDLRWYFESWCIISVSK